MDNTRTFDAKVQSQGKRNGEKYRAAQRRVADKSFTEFVRRHNSELKRG